MSERAHSGAAGQRAISEDLARLELVLAGFRLQLGEPGCLQAAPGAELLARTARLLQDEVDRLRMLLD